MKAKQLLEQLEFHEENPFAQPLLVDENGRILRWMLKPHQMIAEHSVPTSPLYVVVLKGRGVFTPKGEAEQEFGPNSLLIFKPNEFHSVRALDEDLVFVSFLHAAPSQESQAKD